MSLLNLAARNAGSLERLPLSGVASLEAYDYTLDVSENNLISLDCPDTSPNARVLQQVEILVAQQNDLRDLLNIQFSFPNLIVLDVSENSLEAIVSDDQACLSEMHQLDTFIAASNNMVNLSLGSFWPSLKVIDLSGNALREVPNFAPYCPNLITVDLSMNEIDTLQHLAARLPPMIEQLSLNDNAIDDWHRLAQLTAFAETLTAVNIEGNDFCERVRFSWKIFLGWLLPCAVEIDGAAITDHERDAVNDLFKDAQNPNTFSMKLLGTMEEGREVELEAYLNTNCRVGVRPNHPRRISPTPSRNNSYADPYAQPSAPAGGGLQRGRSPQPSPQKQRTATATSNGPDRGSSVGAPSTEAAPIQHIPKLPSVMGTGDLQQQSGTATASPSPTASAASPSSPAVTQALQQLQGKVKVLQDVVKVLRQSDLSRRAHAACTIQKHYRGYRVRRFMMTSEQRHRLKKLHAATLVGFRRGGEPTIGAPSSAGDEQLRAQVDVLTRKVAQYGADMALVQHLAHVARGKAARTIQTYYRGYAARKAFKAIKGAYTRFTAQYVGPATKIQSVIRMYLQRKRYLKALDKHLAYEGLKTDNKMLKARLSAMEKAMAALLSRLETVEQLALLGAEAEGMGPEGDDHGESYYQHKRQQGSAAAASSSGGAHQQQRHVYNASQSLPSMPPSAMGSSSAGPTRHMPAAAERSPPSTVSRRPPSKYDDYDDDFDDDYAEEPKQLLNRRHHAPSP